MAELEGDLPKMHALGDLLHGGSHPEQVRVIRAGGISSQQQSSRGEEPGCAAAPADPNASSKEAALPAPLHGLETSGSCSPFPKGTQGWRVGSTDPGEGRLWDSWGQGWGVTAGFQPGG